MTAEGPRVAVLHHRQWDEWRLPKGKLKAGESAQQAALREVEEELGVQAQVVRPLGSVSYDYRDPYDGRPVTKQVQFFLMTTPRIVSDALETKTFDEVAWLPPEQAAGRLTFSSEQAMVAKAAAALEGDTTLRRPAPLQ